MLWFVFLISSVFFFGGGGGERRFDIAGLCLTLSTELKDEQALSSTLASGQTAVLVRQSFYTLFLRTVFMWRGYNVYFTPGHLGIFLLLT